MLRILLFLLLPISVFANSNVDSTALKISVDTNGIASCFVKGDFGGSVYVEYFLWNKWVRMDTISNDIQWKDTTFVRQVKLYYSNTNIRLCVVETNPVEKIFTSKVSVYKKGFNEDRNCHGFDNNDRGGAICFECIQYWELYNERMEFIAKGTAKCVYFYKYNLPKGMYILNYTPNSTSEFFINNGK